MFSWRAIRDWRANQPKQSNQNALRNRMEELGLSICPPNIVARPPNAYLFNYQISWIPCGFLLPLRGRRPVSPQILASPIIDRELSSLPVFMARDLLCCETLNISRERNVNAEDH